MNGLRRGARGLVVTALGLAACGSPSAKQADARADGRADGPGAWVEEASGRRDSGGPADLSFAPDAGSDPVPSICLHPLTFPASSPPMSACPGAFLGKTTVPFDPRDSRWSALYPACVDKYESPSSVEPSECRQLCNVVGTSSPAVGYAQAITACSLDCSQPQSPVLSVEFSGSICQPSPDGGPEVTTLDAEPDDAPDAESVVDTESP